MIISLAIGILLPVSYHTRKNFSNHNAPQHNKDTIQHRAWNDKSPMENSPR